MSGPSEAQKALDRESSASGAPRPIPDNHSGGDSAEILDRPVNGVKLEARGRTLIGASASSRPPRAPAVIVENLPDVDPEWIEAQLAHSKKGPLGSAYDRAQYLRQRRQMMQTWADYLDRLRDGAQVIPIRAA